MKGDLKFVSMKRGVLSVMMLGIAWMPMLLVDSLDTQDTV